VVDEVLEAHSAGSPTDEAVRWTDLEPVQLSQQVLAGAGYRRRSLRKALISGDVEPHEIPVDRNPAPPSPSPRRNLGHLPRDQRGWLSTRRTPPSGIRSSTVCFVMSRVA